ncbi:MAG: S16 family serine protease [Candidatus Melainabacteria bacterium]
MTPPVSHAAPATEPTALRFGQKHGGAAQRNLQSAGPATGAPADRLTRQSPAQEVSTPEMWPTRELLSQLSDQLIPHLQATNTEGNPGTKPQTDVMVQSLFRSLDEHLLKLATLSEMTGTETMKWQNAMLIPGLMEQRSQIENQIQQYLPDHPKTPNISALDTKLALNKYFNNATLGQRLADSKAAMPETMQNGQTGDGAPATKPVSPVQRVFNHPGAWALGGLIIAAPMLPFAIVTIPLALLAWKVRDVYQKIATEGLNSSFLKDFKTGFQQQFSQLSGGTPNKLTPAMFSTPPATAPGAPISRLENSLRQLMTGYVKHQPLAGDQNIRNLLDYIVSLENSPDAPEGVQKPARLIRAFREEVLNKTRELDADSPQFMRNRLNELYDTSRPESERRLTEEQYKDIDRLVSKLESFHNPRQGQLMVMSPEVQMITSQLKKLLVEFPWDKASPLTTTDRDAMKALLDESHWGMDRVKPQIIDYVLAQQHAADMGVDRKERQAQVLCLVGPPGAGKTTLARDIAKATGREFRSINLAGMHDESEIRGHRPTYMNARPGQPIEKIISAGVNNPVLLLDEIDKSSEVTGQHGKPVNALMELLDPSQNQTFRDNYLEVPMDFSNVMFVATANDLGSIPGPLRDRMRIIEVPGYTFEDKVRIAREHTIPKARHKNGLDRDTLIAAGKLDPAVQGEPFNISDEVIRFLVPNYASGGGVRDLEKAVDRLAQRVASELPSIKDRPYTQADFDRITADKAKEILNRPNSPYKLIDPSPKIGTVNALNGTSPGGALPMDIDIILTPRKTYEQTGGFEKGEITGGLARDSQDSVLVALNFVEKYAKELGLEETLKNNHIKLNFSKRNLSDGVQGPSAGAIITLALISALKSKPIPGDFAMTGQMDLRGNVGIIGGVREKISGSYQQGVRDYLVPLENWEHMQDVPEDIRKNITVKPVTHIVDVMEHLWGADDPVVKNMKAAVTREKVTFLDTLPDSNPSA